MGIFKEQQLNEKVTWKQLLIGLGLLQSVLTYKEYKQIKKVYDVINSSQNLSTKDQEKINKIRDSVISEIKSSNLFNRFGKEFVLDSIRNTQFLISDLSISTENTVACYINLDPLKSRLVSKLAEEPPSDNYIIIRKSYYEKASYNEISQTITHELYHYLDKLIGNKNKYYSDIVNIDKFVENPSKEEAKLKIKDLLALSDDNPKELIDQITTEIYSICMENSDYYASNHEIFTRFKTMKSDMIKLGIIKDINQRVDIVNENGEIPVRRYIQEIKKEKNNGAAHKLFDIISVLIRIKLDKIRELDKII